MMNWSILFIFIQFYLLENFTSQNSDRKQKISDLNVLLPICHSKPCSNVIYKVSAYSGCYRWSIDNANFLEIKQIQDSGERNCFSSVLISTKDYQSEGAIVWLTARDANTHEEFKCKVGFGYVTQVSIAKRFDHMNVGELVELQTTVTRIKIGN